METDMMDVYIVTTFGCDSGHNDMYPPTVSVYTERERAYETYNDEKDRIIEMQKNCGIDYRIYREDDGECIIQEGPDENNGAKRPIGVKITKQTII